MGNRVFNLFIFSNVFIAACAALMVVQTYTFLLDSPANIYFVCFVLCSTICSYSFHWYLTPGSIILSPRIKWTHENRLTLLFLFFIGLIGSGIFFCYLLPYWIWLFLSAVMTFLYSAPKIPHKYFRLLRKIALGKTIFLALVWTHVTTILPIIISTTKFVVTLLVIMTVIRIS